MQEKLKIGLIVKPQGIKGELKVMPLTDDITRFKKLKKVYIDENLHRVSGVKIAGNSVLLALSEITDRNTSESYRGKYLSVDREDAVRLEEGRFFVTDLIGLNVVTEEGENQGEITEITEARTDIVVMVKNGKTARFPFLKDLLVKVDFDNNAFIVKSQRLKEVTVYED